MPIGLSQLFMNCSETSQALNAGEKNSELFPAETATAELSWQKDVVILFSSLC